MLALMCGSAPKSKGNGKKPKRTAGQQPDQLDLGEADQGDGFMQNDVIGRVTCTDGSGKVDQAQAEPLQAAQRVCIHNLQSRADLNGTHGIVVEVLSTGRVRVALPGGAFIAIKPENLSAAAPATDEAIEPNDQHACFSVNSCLRVWANVSFLYAFGNTPAKLLIQQVPLYVPTANILLLGCGDPRHVLYTLHCMKENKGLSAEQRLDVTMCDMEPSILARNIMLFHMIHRNTSPAICWAVFYALKVDIDCMAVIVQTAQALLGLADTLQAWHATSFGQIIRFCDEDSFQAIRRMWTAYSAGKVSNSVEKACVAWQKQSVDKIGDSSVIMTSATQTVPCVVEALRNVRVHTSIFKQFHSQGSAPQVIYRSTGATHYNPLFLTGASQKPQWHYGLDFLCCFHLSTIYMAMQQVTADELLRECLRQFSAWCAGFHDAMLANKIVIRHFAGDMFDCCRAINAARWEPVAIIPSGKVSKLRFKDTPTAFDLIDSSNTSDHTGLLNVLLACRPLLCQGFHARIAIETLTSATKENSKLDDVFAELLRCSVPTFAALTGLSFVEAGSYVTESYRLMHSGGSPTSQMGARRDIYLQWLYHQPTKLDVNLDSLKACYRVMYDKLFKPVYGLMDAVMTGGMKSMADTLLTNMTGQNDFAQPTAQAFAVFLRHSLQHLGLFGQAAALDMVQTLTMDIIRTGFQMQSLYAQELIMWLATYGLLSADDYSEFMAFSLTMNGIEEPSSLSLRGVHQITLLVPRAVMEARLATILCPMLEMQISSGLSSMNTMATFHLGFAKSVVPAGQTHPGMLALENFSLEPGDSSDYSHVVCTAMVSSACLHIAASEDTHIQLILSPCMSRRNPTVAFTLGPQLLLHSAALSDRRSVSCLPIEMSQLVKQITTLSCPAFQLNQSALVGCNGLGTSASCTPWQIQWTATGSTSGCRCTITLEASKLRNAQLQMVDRPNPLHARLLLSDRMDKDFIDLRLPMRIDSSRASVQVSRTKGLVIITCGAVRAFPHGVFRSMFMHRDEAHSGLVMTGASRALLSAMPAVDPKSRSLDWLFTLAGAQVMLSERGPEKEKTPFLSYRETIHSILLNYTNNCGQGEQYGFRALFCLATPSHGTEIILLVNALRMDPTQGSVILDCAICILEPSFSPLVAKWAMLSENSDIRLIVNITDGEVLLWKKHLPVCCERARNGWKHHEHCEYLSGEVPMHPAMAMGGQVVCSCCMGQDLQGTRLAAMTGKAHKHVVQHFFRAAISPAFPAAFSDMFSRRK